MEVLQLSPIRFFLAKVRTRDGSMTHVLVAVVVDPKTGKKSVVQPNITSRPVHERLAKAVVENLNAAAGKPPLEDFEDLDLTDFLAGDDIVMDPEEDVVDEPQEPRGGVATTIAVPPPRPRKKAAPR